MSVHRWINVFAGKPDKAYCSRCFLSVDEAPVVCIPYSGEPTLTSPDYVRQIVADAIHAERARIVAVLRATAKNFGGPTMAALEQVARAVEGES